MKFLSYYAVPDADGDVVLIGVTDLGSPELTGVIRGSDAALQAAALVARKTTWDRQTICDVHGLARKAQQPAQPNGAQVVTP